VWKRLKVRSDQATIDKPFAGMLENIQVQHCHVNTRYLKALGLKAVSVPVINMEWIPAMKSGQETQ